MDVRLDYPATQRNREPIANALVGRLPETGHVLEIGSGSGQHVIYFAQRFPKLTFQPSDPDPNALASIAGWTAAAAVANVAAPLSIDAAGGRFPLPPGSIDVVFSANMIHIAPWAACLGLLQGAAACLKPGGQLVLYGPFQLDGAHTADSNRAFDASLRTRDPAWGVRDLNEVQRAAVRQKLELHERVPMPANNQLVFFRLERPAPPVGQDDRTGGQTDPASAW